MRQTEYRRRNTALAEEIFEEVQKVSQDELNWLFRQIRYKVRRLDGQRMKVTTASPRLQKSYVVSGNLWDFFVQRMRRAVTKAIVKGAIKLATLQRNHFLSFKPVEFDPEEFAKFVEPEIGERIVGVSNTIKRQVGAKVVGWYNSPGTTMQSLVDQLKPTFGEKRARLIAQTEVTRLNSEVKYLTAEQIGATEWWWSTRRDNLVCVKPLRGPDGKVYKGCRELHGKTFDIGLLMPPDGSHPGCRCDPVIVPPSTAARAGVSKPVIAGLMKYDPLAKADFIESEHPRDEEGKFTDKGTGVSGGSSEPAYKQTERYKGFRAKLQEWSEMSEPEYEGFEIGDALEEAYDFAMDYYNEGGNSEFPLATDMRKDYFGGEPPDEITVYGLYKEHMIWGPNDYYTDLEAAKKAARETGKALTAFTARTQGFVPLDFEKRNGLISSEYISDSRKVDLDYKRPTEEPALSMVADTEYNRSINKAFNVVCLPRACRDYKLNNPDKGEITTQEYADRCEKFLKRELADTDVCVRLTPTNLKKVLEEGKYKSVFEAKRSGAYGYKDRKNHYLERRREAEDEMFGISKDADRERPVYGYLAGKGETHPEDYMLEQYGSVAITLKEEVRKRVTFTTGDSLDSINTRGFAYIVPDGEKIETGRGAASYIDNPKVQSISFIANFTDWLSSAENSEENPGKKDWTVTPKAEGPYWEAQVQKGFSASEIKSVSFIGQQPSDDIVKLLEKQGIEWKFEKGRVAKMLKADEPVGRLIATNDYLELYALDGEQGYVVNSETGKRYPTHEIASILSRGYWEMVEDEDLVKFDPNQPRDEDGKWTDGGSSNEEGGQEPSSDVMLGESLEFKVHDDIGKPPEAQFTPYYTNREEVEKNFGVHEQNYAKKLTSKEKSALVEYTEYGAEMNDLLRGGGGGLGDGDELSEEEVKVIDTAIEKASFPKRASVTRYVMADSEALKQIEQLKGKIIQDAGFLSTSLEERAYAPLLEDVMRARIGIEEEDSSGLGAVVMRINIPKGAHAALLQGVGDVYSSSEVLLPRNARLRVRQVYDVVNENYKVGKFPTKQIVLDLIP